MQRRVHVPIADLRPRSADVSEPQPEFCETQSPVRVADVAQAAKLQPPVRRDRQEEIVL